MSPSIDTKSRATQPLAESFPIAIHVRSVLVAKMLTHWPYGTSPRIWPSLLGSLRILRLGVVEQALMGVGVGIAGLLVGTKILT